MTDTGSRLDVGDVVDGAAAYIASHQTIHGWQLAVNFNRFSACNVVGIERPRERLKAIDVSAGCRGLPYATLNVTVDVRENWLTLMHALAFLHGITGDIWTKRDIDNTLTLWNGPQ